MRNYAIYLWGATMTEIPYYFETPIPKYFRETGWFNKPNTILFVTWAFSKCSCEVRTIVHDGREITLQPYEFITGRGTSSTECLLSESAMRHQLKMLLCAGLLKKTTNSMTNRYTCYIWVTERFLKPNNQLNNQLSADCAPTERPQSRRKKIRSKESHPSIPSKNSEAENRDDGRTDDFSFENELVEVIPGVSMTKRELAACIVIKGDINKVKYAVEYIQKSKKRKHAISDWFNALARWKIEDKVQVNAQDNLAYAEKICKQFPEYENGQGWRCYLYNNKKKDQRGILFEPQSVYQEAFFIALVDPEMRNKCENFIKTKKMDPKTP